MRAGLAGLLLAALCTLAAARAEALVIGNVHVVTLEGETVLRNRAVVVEAGRIVAVVPMAELALPEGATWVDGQGGYLAPGLVDSHVHMETYMDARPDFGDAPVFLRHGITAVFNLRGFPEHLLLRERIAAGELLAPMLYTAGEFVNEPRVNTPAEAAAEVRAQAAAGYDMIKFREVVEHGVGVLTTHGVDLDTFRAVHASAREQGIPVLGHAPHGLGLGPVLETGHTLAHVGELVGLHFFPPWVPFQRPLYHAALGALALLAVVVLGARLARRRTAPTLARVALAGLLVAATAYLLPLALLPGGWRHGDPLLIGLLGLCLVLLLALGLHALWRTLRRDEGVTTRLVFAAAAAALLSAAALSGFQDLPMALRSTAGGVERTASSLAASGAATVEPARFLGREHDFGRIAPGQRADLLLLEGNPLEDIAVLGEPQAVVLRGRWLPRAEIDAMVATLAAEAAAAPADAR
jgi:hypothetical protein